MCWFKSQGRVHFFLFKVEWPVELKHWRELGWVNLFRSLDLESELLSPSPRSVVNTFIIDSTKPPMFKFVIVLVIDSYAAIAPNLNSRAVLFS